MTFTLNSLVRTCKQCNEEFKPYIYIHEKRIPLYRRTKCYECLPYVAIGKNKFIGNTRNTIDGKRQCLKCMKYKKFKYFSITNKQGHLKTYCKICVANKGKTTRQKIKQKFVDYKGGQCIRCGYNKCIAALEFHHRDRTKKEFQISYNRNINNENLKFIYKELDKCDLLCSNCHKEVHYLI